MRRFRSNQEFSLASPTSAPTRVGSPPVSDARGLWVCGMVINPRNNEPVLVTTDGEHVGIRSLLVSSLLARHGSGYYDYVGHGQSEKAEELTGFPRSHTPQGVTPRGGGYGTSLYTALALGAYLTDKGRVEIKMSVQGDGICSETEGRSREADTWWNAASTRGLTEKRVEEVESSEENVDMDVDADDLERVVSLEEGQKITYVNAVNVDIESSSEFVVDSYGYTDSAWTSHLVPCEMVFESEIPNDIQRGSEMRYLFELAMEDPDVFEDTDEIALLALDVRGLDIDAMNLLSLAYLKHGLKDQDVDALWYRHKYALDPGAAMTQMRLFTPNQQHQGALADVIDARKAADWESLADLP